MTLSPAELVVALPQALVVGLMMGALYALMAIGITFIASVMKMINWSMGEFYMMGSYIQLILLVGLIPPGGSKPPYAAFIETLPGGPSVLEFTGLGTAGWPLALVLVLLIVFAVGVVLQRLLIAPMFKYEQDRRFEYATIITIALSVLLQNVAIIVAGPYQWRPRDYLPSIPLPDLNLILQGSRVAGALGAVLIMVLFYIFVRHTLVGLSFLGTAQNRLGAQTAGVKLPRVDMIGFGIGVALAAAAGALLAPVYLVHPANGAASTVKGFEIIVIGGLGSLPGAVIAAFALALVEALGAVILDPAYQDLYGFVFLIGFLLLRPQGLFGERERRV